MSFLLNNQESCPRLLDYLVVVGSKYPSPQKHIHSPKLLRRYPPTNYSDFLLPVDLVSFCQPDGCLTNFNKRLCLQETTSFVFTLTEKDSGLVRFGICLNFYRPIGRQCCEKSKSDISKDRQESKISKKFLKYGTHSLTSLCIISHYPFFSKFRQCLYILKNIIEKAHNRLSKNIDYERVDIDRMESVWSLLLGLVLPKDLRKESPVLITVSEIESWILRLLSATAPQPGKNCLFLTVLPESVQDPLVFALPDKTRLSLVDFPLHLPLELLGIDTCLKLLTAIILEQKVVVQSRDYNALTMSVMAFVALLYPLQYMFPVIPLLPTCMTDAEQLLLAPTPYLIGLPASFLSVKKGFQLPSDVWLVDLDSNKLVSSANSEPLPNLPEPERTELVQHLQQAMASIHSAPPINNLDQFDEAGLILPPTNKDLVTTNSRPLIFGNDVDSVDVATRVAMVKFFNSSNILANFTEHTRTLRLYPRPVVMFQYLSFMKSRGSMTAFTKRLARTQAVEYLAEWSLCPENEVFQRIHAGLYDPAVIGDKPKWYSTNLMRTDFMVSRLPDKCTLHLNWDIHEQPDSDEASDLELSSEEERDTSTLSSYSSYSDFLSDVVDSGISTDTVKTSDEHEPIEAEKLSVNLQDVFVAPTLVVKDKDDLSLISSSSEHENDSVQEDNENNTSSDQASNRERRSKPTKPSPIRPPPPTKVGSIGSHPGTPAGAPKMEDKNFFPDGSYTNFRDPSQKKDKENESQSNASSDSEITGLDLLKDIGEQMTGVASQASSTINDILGSKGLSVSKFTKPYSHLAPKKSLIEKSFLSQQAYNSLLKTNNSNITGLVSSIDNKKTIEKQTQKAILQEQMRNNAQSSENQTFLKDVVMNILKGSTPSVFNRSKVAKLLEDENYRNFILSKLYVSLERKVSENQLHIEDVYITKKSIFKAIQWLLSITIQGLESSCRNRGLGGMASAFLLLEILHTHHLSTQAISDSGTGSQTNLSQASTPDSCTDITKAEDNIMNTVDLVRAKSPIAPPPAESVEPPLADQDLLRSLVIGKSTKLTKMMSIESEKSDMVGTSSSSVVSNSRITHEAIRPVVLQDPSMILNCKDHYAENEENVGTLYPKCKWSGRYRYRGSRLLTVERNTISENGQRNILPQRVYLFELFVNDLDKLRHSLWANLQFWEDVFLDTVAQERDMVGMDQGTVEMMKRYANLSRAEKKRLQLDEDRLLSTLLFNLTAFMLMMRMDVNDIKNKIRRILASCHLGLHYSQQINHLLDNLQKLQANDIDLKPMVSRLMQRKSFTVHWGTEATGDILFFEVFDDCIILRSISGAIVDRWWFEKIIHFSFCPKTKVVVFWMKDGAKIAHNKLYTKKCKELYNCVKETLEKAAARTMENSHLPPEMGGEFTIRDRSNDEEGTIQVCMDGLSISFPSKQHFIPIAQIRRCLTHKGDTFIIEIIDPSTKQIKLKKYFSRQASNITYSVLCLFSYLAASLHTSPSPTISVCSDLDKLVTNTVGSNTIRSNIDNVSLSPSQSADFLT